MSIVTLLTDFGTRDGFVGMMKGVILSICPEVEIVDISHEISPQNILEASYVLHRTYSHFPAGTIHVAVIDPGVGTQRRPIGLSIGPYHFITPDNGLITLILSEAERQGVKYESVHLDDKKFWLPETSHTFHGRDIFAPVAAHLAKGTPLTDLGSIILDPVTIDIPRPIQIEAGWQSHIIAIDRFGNLATDLACSELPLGDHVLISVKGYQIEGITRSYAEKPPGELIALIDSCNRLEIAVVNGSAEAYLGAVIGDLVEVNFLC